MAKHSWKEGDYATTQGVASYLCYDKWVEQNAAQYTKEYHSHTVSPRVGELVRVLAIAPHNTSDSNSSILALCRLVKRDALTLVDVDTLEYNTSISEAVSTRLQNEAYYAAARYIQTYCNCEMDKAIACAKRVAAILKEYNI